MKVTYILPIYWPAIGGCELHTRHLVNLIGYSHEVRVITLLDNQKDKEKGGEFWFGGVLCAPKHNKFYHDGNIVITKLGLTVYERWLAFVLVKTQTNKIPKPIKKITLRLLVNLYAKKLASIIGETDIIHAVHCGVAWFDMAALHLAKRLKIPFIYTALSHLYKKNATYIAHITIKELPFTERGPVNQIWLNTCYQADAIITMTDFEREFFLKNKINTNVYTTGVGAIVTTNVTGDFKERYGFLDKFMVLFLGRNNKDKGVEELLNATRLVWQKNPDVYFVFAGPLEFGVEELFKHYADSRIILCGPLETEDKSSALKSSDIICIPSVVESLGGVFLEAWTFKKPVIAADIPPIRELSGGGQGGVLIKPTPENIANAILLLLDNPNLRQTMGTWGKRMVNDKYNWQHIASTVEQIYQSAKS
ncbi:MAG: glycosyltransferase family 4 protein [Candidatus Magnetoovum sp. WYHC-5]|nr:glycosyltransferase family 4 protein [Candidatus Magnetoovum sp. WYHC-5]